MLRVVFMEPFTVLEGEGREGAPKILSNAASLTQCAEELRDRLLRLPPEVWLGCGGLRPRPIHFSVNLAAPVELLRDCDITQRARRLHGALVPYRLKIITMLGGDEALVIPIVPELAAVWGKAPPVAAQYPEPWQCCIVARGIGALPKGIVARVLAPAPVVQDTWVDAGFPLCFGPPTSFMLSADEVDIERPPPKTPSKRSEPAIRDWESFVAQHGTLRTASGEVAPLFWAAETPS